MANITFKGHPPPSSGSTSSAIAMTTLTIEDSDSECEASEPSAVCTNAECRARKKLRCFQKGTRVLRTCLQCRRGKMTTAIATSKRAREEDSIEAPAPKKMITRSAAAIFEMTTSSSASKITKSTVYTTSSPPPAVTTLKKTPMPNSKSTPKSLNSAKTLRGGAARKVFAIPELLESILLLTCSTDSEKYNISGLMAKQSLQLRMLLVSQRVSRDFYMTINGSSKLLRELWLKPSSGDLRGYNPIFCYGDGKDSRSWQSPLAINIETEWRIEDKGSRQNSTKEGSWERMLITQGGTKLTGWVHKQLRDQMEWANGNTTWR